MPPKKKTSKKPAKKKAKKTAKRKATKKPSKSKSNGSDMVIDISFLEEGDWAKVNMSQSELVAELEQVWEAESILRPQVKKNNPKLFERKVLSTFEGRMRRKLASTAQAGNESCYIFGMSMPFDPYAAMAGKCMNEYQKDPTGAMNKFVKTRKNKRGKREVYPIFYPTYAKDTRDRIGKEIKGTSWMTSIVGVWGPQDAKKTKPFVTIAGGSFGDEHVSLKCPNCGNESVFKICPDCGTKKAFVLPEIMKRMFHPCSFDMRVKVDDQGNETIAWTKQTVPKLKDNPTEKQMDIWGLLEGNKVLRGHRITTKSVLSTYKKYKNNRNWWVWISCEVVRVIPNEDKKGNKKIIVSDEHFSLMDSNGRVREGITVRLPPHIWEHQMSGKIGQGSSIIVVGKVDGFKGNDGTFITYLEAWGIWGVPGLVNVPPKVENDLEEEEGFEISDEESLENIELGDGETEDFDDDDEEWDESFNDEEASDEDDDDELDVNLEEEWE